MNYLSVAEARELSGLRLVLSAHVPGPWGEAAKAIFAARRVSYAPVSQMVFEPNLDLVAWTGIRNAPIAVLDNERPVADWLGMVMLAERLGSRPSLLPPSSAARAQCLGLSAEICAPFGFGWMRRLVIMAGALEATEATPEFLQIGTEYGHSADALSQANLRQVDILTTLAAQLHAQRASGSAYLVGDSLTACDLHWACFSLMVAPLPHADAPMPEPVRQLYGQIDPQLAAALDPILIEHRDAVYERHIGLPLDF